MAKMRWKIFLTKIQMSNDFLVKVKEAEEKASDMIKKATLKRQEDLLKYKQELTKNQETNFVVAQDKMKNELQKSRTESRGEYEEKVSIGDSEVAKMKSEKINMLDGLMAGAEELLLSNL